MKKKLDCIMLVDDSSDDNFFHERVINKSDLSEKIILKNSAAQALEYLRSTKNGGNIRPDLILLDINMPGMTGWDFLEEYRNLDPEQKSDAIITMLSTSENLEDYRRALAHDAVSDFKTKPLTKEMLEYFVKKYF